MCSCPAVKDAQELPPTVACERIVTACNSNFPTGYPCALPLTGILLVNRAPLLMLNALGRLNADLKAIVCPDPVRWRTCDAPCERERRLAVPVRDPRRVTIGRDAARDLAGARELEQCE